MIINPEIFLTKTLQSKPWGDKVARILSASLAAADPAYSVTKALCCYPNEITLPSRTYNLSNINNIYVLAIGKASRPMARSAAEMLGPRLTSGIILSKTVEMDPSLDQVEKFTTYLGGHPIPSAESVKSTSEIIQSFSNLSKDDLVLLLISGGGSALLCAPANGLSLADLQATNQALLNCGADIKEINAVRKHISRVKGGRLAEILSPASQITLILSDVIGDPADMIASGPTVGDKTTYQDVQQVIKKYSLADLLPTPVLDHINQGLAGEIPETPKPDHPLFEDHYHWILAGNQDAVMGGIQQAKDEGFSVDQFHTEPGEAREQGAAFGSYLKLHAQEPGPSSERPFCLIWGGENTVSLPSKAQIGLGGRNLEFALSAVKSLHGLKDVALVTLATDGEDGVTDAAGAVVTGETYQRAKDLGLDPDEYLKKHDSYTFFKALDDLLQPGPTQTNVNDLCFGFAF